jgi:hypothetical protein
MGVNLAWVGGVNGCAVYPSSTKALNSNRRRGESNDSFSHEGLQSSELGPPPPQPKASVAPPSPLRSKGVNTLACGEGVGGTNSDEGTYTSVQYVYYNPSTKVSIKIFRTPLARTEQLINKDFERKS